MVPSKRTKSGRDISVVVFCALISAYAVLHAQAQSDHPVEVRVKAGDTSVHLSSMLYGLMTEEINYSLDGGLYGELLRNRSFAEDGKEPVHWQLIAEAGGTGFMSLDPGTPLNDAIRTSLKLTATKLRGVQRVGVANEGFWGIPVRADTSYKASFYAKSAPGFDGTLTVAIASSDGSTVHATAQVPRITGTWKKYEVTLTTGAVGEPCQDRFAISVNREGSVWLSMVSLFPPTYANRANGNRPDLMEMLADMQPSFLRLPGGNYLEGNTIATRFDWKKAIGDVSTRPGHMNDAWKYWSSDGMGLLEFLNWCEDLHMEPVLAVYAGYSLKGERVAPGPALQPFVTDALDEIEYVTGDVKTIWGARRAKDGHPAPFRLRYVEVGNEDQFDRVGGGTYDGRFAQFHAAIKARYPRLAVIATAGTPSTTPDVIDEHYYRNSEEEMASHAHDYDTRPRTGPKVMVGEWATRVGDPTPTMSAALGDAAWMTGMERNSDLVIMSSYAPLFVNVNKGGMQWRTDLIGCDSMTSYGSPAYWAQQMFSRQHGDLVLPISASAIPTREWQPPARGGRGQEATTPVPPATQQIPLVFFSATRDSSDGTIYLKVVNRAGAVQPVHVSLSGLRSVEPNGQVVVMAASSPSETNSITEPRKLTPVATEQQGFGTDFTRAFPPYSITVLELKAK